MIAFRKVNALNLKVGDLIYQPGMYALTEILSIVKGHSVVKITTEYGAISCPSKTLVPVM